MARSTNTGDKMCGMALFPRLTVVLLLLATLGWTTPALARTPDCFDVEPGMTSLVTMPGSERPLLLYFPRSFSVKRPAPLVLVLHGSGGTGRAVLEHSQLAETADRHGFIVAAPDGGIPLDRGFVWNIPGVPAVSGRMPAEGDSDDTAFLGQTVDWLVARRCADPNQVYATGISGGGRMASWLACVQADRFAAIAPVVGLRSGNPLTRDPAQPDPTTCRPSRPMPILTFAGDADTVNPISGGGAPYWQYSMRAAIARWAELNGCKTRVAPRPIVADKIYEEGFTNCRNDADVLARVTVGGAHDWVADNEAMWAFFAAHRRTPR